MRVDVVRPADLGPAEAHLWAEFQRLSPETLDPFFSLTFARAVASARADARVAIIYNGGRIEGFLPFERGRHGIGVPIGAPMNNLQGFLGMTAASDARAVVRQAGLRGWQFPHAPAGQPALSRHYYAGTTVRSPVIDLSAGYPAYIASRSRHLTKETRRKRRALERQLGTEVSFEWKSTRPLDHLQQLIEWKSAQYRGTRLLFTDPSALRIVSELAVSQSTDCQGLVNVLLADGRPIAIRLGLLGPKGLSSWFASYDPTLSRFSPGMMMMFPLAESAAAHGVGQIDLGYGQHDYKFLVANGGYQVAGGAIWANRAERAGRAVYRQLWYNRNQHVTASARSPHARQTRGSEPAGAHS